MIKDIFMPLGSLLNAYGNINSGKGITPEQMIEDTKILVEFAQELVEPKKEIDISNNNKLNFEDEPK